MRSIFKRTGSKFSRKTKVKSGTLALMIICGLYSSDRISAQAPTWQWAKSSAGEPNTTVTSIASDAQGNIYITGDFAGGDLKLGTITLSGSVAAANTVFLAKYDKNGNVLWAKCCEQGFNSGSSAIATDAQGNVYIAGYFTSWIKFGQTTLTSSGSTDIFIAKFSSAGNVLWSKRAGGSESDGAAGLATDSDGNVALTGSFTGPSLSFGNQTLNGGTSANLFIAKFDSNGTSLWLKGGTTTGSSATGKIVIDGSKNIYVTGQYRDAPLTLGTTTLPVVGGSDIFVAKLDQSGTTTWAKGFGGTSEDQIGGIAIDAAANVYVCATYLGTLTFGTNTLTSAGNMDCMIAKFSVNGQPVWAKSGGGEGTDFAAAIAVDKNGQINMIGTYGMYNKTAVFNTTTLPNAGMSDLFLTRYDANGALLFAYGLGGDQSESGSAITTDASSNIYVTGTFSSASVAFGTTTLTKAANDGTQLYLAKYGPPPTGIEQIRMNDTWAVYPNPGNGIFHIDYPKKINEIRICNLLGQEVYRSSTINVKEKVNLEDQPDGLYWLHIYTDEGYGVKQIAKK